MGDMYKIYNYNRAFSAAAAMLTHDAETMDNEPKVIAKAVGELAKELAKVQDKFFEKEGLDKVDGAADTPSRPSRSIKPSSSSRKPSGRRSSGGRKPSGGGGAGKGLSAAQKRLVDKTVGIIEADGSCDFEPHTVESIEAVYDFGERSKMISENRLWAFYDGDVDEYFDDPDNERNELPDEYYD